MDTPTEAEMGAYITNLHELEVAGERAPISMGPFTAIIVIGALQLATRHPTMPDHQKAAIASVIDQFRPWFAGTMGEQIIDMGNDPALDQPPADDSARPGLSVEHDHDPVELAEMPVPGCAGCETLTQIADAAGKEAARAVRASQDR